MNNAMQTEQQTQKERLEMVERCQPDLLIHHIRHDTAFDADMLTFVFELAKQQAQKLLSEQHAA